MESTESIHASRSRPVKPPSPAVRQIGRKVLLYLLFLLLFAGLAFLVLV
jgi:hypothetical protein